jgi:heme exporter protein D
VSELRIKVSKFESFKSFTELFRCGDRESFVWHIQAIGLLLRHLFRAPIISATSILFLIHINSILTRKRRLSIFSEKRCA